MKRLLPCLSLLFAAALLFCGLSLGCDGLTRSRENGAVLWEPPVHSLRKTPGVLLCGADRATAVELARRGYAVVCCSPGKEADAYALLCGREQVDAYNVAFMVKGKQACEALTALDREQSETDYAPRALILWDASVEAEGLSNVLCIAGSEETELTGYFADGSARQTLPRRSKCDTIRESIDWLGSCLGHPRDGVLADDQLVLPFSALCYCFSALAAGFAVYLIGKGKKNAERME